MTHKYLYIIINVLYWCPSPLSKGHLDIAHLEFSLPLAPRLILYRKL